MPAIAETKKLLTDWLLIVYDIPAGRNEEEANRNDAFRAYWIYNAKRLGAVRHTESVYYAPFHPRTMQLAQEIAERAGGQVYIFHSKITTPAAAKDFTTRYDKAIEEEYFDELEQRIKEAEESIVKEENNRITAQKVRACKFFLNLCDSVVARRASPDLETRFRAFQTYIPKLEQSYQKRKAEQEAAKARAKA